MPKISAGAEVSARIASSNAMPLATALPATCVARRAWWPSLSRCVIATVTPASARRFAFSLVAASCEKLAGRFEKASTITGISRAARRGATRQPSSAPTMAMRRARFSSLKSMIASRSLARLAWNRISWSPLTAGISACASIRVSTLPSLWVMKRAAKKRTSSNAPRSAAQAAGRDPPDKDAPRSPSTTKAKARSRKMLPVRPVVSARNPCPPNNLELASGATARRVNPSSRVIAIGVASGLNPSAPLSAAEKAELLAPVSLVAATPLTSDRPVRENAEIRPGVTHSARISVAPAGTGVVAGPTATMRPSLMTTTPSEIVPWLVPVHTVSPYRATGWAAATEAAPSAARPRSRWRIICGLLRRVGQARNPSPAGSPDRCGQTSGRRRCTPARPSHSC